MRLRIFFVLVLVFVLPLLAVSAQADGVLPTQLASFAVLGASTVTNTGSTTLVSGNVGVDPGSAIVPGSIGFTFAGPSPGTSIVNGIANTAQTQLDTAMGLLGGLATSGSPILGGVLNGLTLTQGVYALSAAPGNGGFNLSTGGVLTLDAQGQTNPFWVFQASSTLVTGSNSVVQFINAPSVGFNPGVYWNVGSSATLGTNSTFQGNILAEISVGLTTGAIIGCGRALADTGAVTMDTNTISTGCNGSLSVSSGGVVIGPGGTPLATPEPGTFALLSSGLLGMVFLAFRKPRVSSLSC